MAARPRAVRPEPAARPPMLLAAALLAALAAIAVAARRAASGGAVAAELATRAHATGADRRRAADARSSIRPSGAKALRRDVRVSFEVQRGERRPRRHRRSS